MVSVATALLVILGSITVAPRIVRALSLGLFRAPVWAGAIVFAAFWILIESHRQYLLNLLNNRPADLNLFLRYMFRVEFLDDYTSLKPLINYDDLAGLIDRHVSDLEPDKVKQFRSRYEAERTTGSPIA